jgi:hypothetical protein
VLPRRTSPPSDDASSIAEKRTNEAPSVVISGGGNFEIQLVRGIAVCRVWRRPDVTREEGARYAEKMVQLMTDAATGMRIAGKAAILDMSDAPTSWGPATETALGRIFVEWERSRRRIAAQMSGDPVQSLLLRRMCRQHAPSFGVAVTTRAEAEQWIAKGISPSRSAPR